MSDIPELPSPDDERNLGLAEHPVSISEWSRAIPINIAGKSLAQGPITAPPEVGSEADAGEQSDWVTMLTIPSYSYTITVAGVEQTYTQPEHELQGCVTADNLLCLRLHEYGEGGECEEVHSCPRIPVNCAGVASGGNINVPLLVGDLATRPAVPPEGTVMPFISFLGRLYNCDIVFGAILGNCLYAWTDREINDSSASARDNIQNELVNGLPNYPGSLFGDTVPPAELTAGGGVGTGETLDTVPLGSNNAILPTLPLRVASCTLGDYGLVFGSQIMTVGEETINGERVHKQRLNDSLPWAVAFSFDTSKWAPYNPEMVHVYGVYHNGTYCFRSEVTQA